MKDRLRQALLDQAQTGNPTTYDELAGASDLSRRRQFIASVKALETLVKEDVVAIESFSLHGRELEANASAGVPAFPCINVSGL